MNLKPEEAYFLRKPVSPEKFSSSHGTKIVPNVIRKGDNYFFQQVTLERCCGFNPKSANFESAEKSLKS